MEHPDFGDLITANVLALSSSLAIPVVTIVHELGHAIALKILFKDVRPKITLRNWGFDGGSTTSAPLTDLTFLGKFLGVEGSLALEKAAGPIIETITCLGLGALTGHYNLVLMPFLINAVYSLDPDKSSDCQAIRDKYPKIGRVFTAALLGTTGLVYSKSNAITKNFHFFAGMFKRFACP